MVRCSAITVSGKRCQRTTTTGIICFQHAKTPKVTRVKKTVGKKDQILKSAGNLVIIQRKKYTLPDNKLNQEYMNGLFSVFLLKNHNLNIDNKSDVAKIKTLLWVPKPFKLEFDVLGNHIYGASPDGSEQNILKLKTIEDVKEYINDFAEDDVVDTDQPLDRYLLTIAIPGGKYPYEYLLHTKNSNFRDGVKDGAKWLSAKVKVLDVAKMS